MRTLRVWVGRTSQPAFSQPFLHQAAVSSVWLSHPRILDPGFKPGPPGPGRSPGGGHGNPTAVFLPGESHGQRSLVGYGPWGHKESDMTERLNSNIPGVTILWTAGQHQYGVCDVTSSLKRWPLNALGLRFPELPPQSTTTWVA